MPSPTISIGWRCLNRIPVLKYRKRRLQLRGQRRILTDFPFHSSQKSLAKSTCCEREHSSKFGRRVGRVTCLSKMDDIERAPYEQEPLRYVQTLETPRGGRLGGFLTLAFSDLVTHAGQASLQGSQIKVIDADHI